MAANGPGLTQWTTVQRRSGMGALCPSWKFTNVEEIINLILHLKQQWAEISRGASTGDRRTCEALLKASRRAPMLLHSEGGLLCNVYVMAMQCWLEIALIAHGRLPTWVDLPTRWSSSLRQESHKGCGKSRKRTAVVGRQSKT